MREDRVQEFDDSDLKLFHQDALGEPVKLWKYIRTKELVNEEAEADEWLVEKILKHRWNQEAGQWDFLVKWEG